MSKYSFEFKHQLVHAYLNNEGSYVYISGKDGVTASNIKSWVKAYKEFGIDSLVRSKKIQSYSFEFKWYVVELYLSTEVSYQELALSAGINNSSMITKCLNQMKPKI